MAEQLTLASAAQDGVKIGSERSFGMVFAAVFTIIAGWPLLRGGETRWWAFAIATIFLIAGIARPDALTTLNRVWFKFGLLLSRVTTPLVMGLLFFAVVTPTALVMRLRGKDLLKQRLEPEAQSYWILRDPAGPDPATMKHQF
jgi:predicted membrane metal-binding protein